MKMRVLQHVLPVHDVLDETFQRRFEDVVFLKSRTIDDFRRMIPDADALWINTSSYKPEIAESLLASAQRLTWIQFVTVGIDRAIRVGLPPHATLTNLRGVRSATLAQHAITLMLCAMRGIRRFEPFRAERQWARFEMQDLVMSPRFGTAVVVGMGSVGREIARLLKALDMKVIGVSRAGRPDRHFDRAVPRAALSDLLPEADAVFVATALDDGTRGLIGAAEFSRMRPTAVFVNIARGAIADERALAAALESRAIFAAGIDVAADEPLQPQSPLWGLENLVITPHIGGVGGSSDRLAIAEFLADNLRRYLDGRPLLNVIGHDGMPMD